MKTKTYTIFIVDDNNFNLQMISKQLKGNLKCRTRMYQTPQECLEAMDTEIPDMVLTDYNLTEPGERKTNGDWLLKSIKNKYPDLPVVLYSSMQSLKLAVNLMRHGAIDFVLRDERFFSRISQIAKNHLEVLKKRSYEKKIRYFVLSLIAIVSGAFLLMENIGEEWLIYFTIGLLAIYGVAIFLAEPIQRLMHRGEKMYKVE